MEGGKSKGVGGWWRRKSWVSELDFTSCERRVVDVSSVFVEK